MKEKASSTDLRKIRSFIALELSDEARGELSRVTALLKKADADVKWVPPHAVHLTLKFLGSVPESKLATITGILKAVAASVPPFEIVLNGVGVFPSWNYARVLWVGVGEGSARVKEVAGRVEEALVREGFEREKRSFSPHLTVGRIRKARNKEELKRVASSITVRPISSRISSVVIFKSVLTPEGALYTPLHTIDFKG